MENDQEYEMELGQSRENIPNFDKSKKILFLVLT